MAEAVVFSLASNILSIIASPHFKMAYEKGISIWQARNELSKLQVSMETIQVVLLDAEKKQDGSGAIKKWIKRLKGVLYDAEDLFDEVLTKNLVKQQMMGRKNKLSLKNQVRVSCSKFNPIVSRSSIAKKVRGIRMSLDGIYRDMAQFEFARCQDEKLMFNMGRGEDRGNFVDAESVIGRDKDKEILFKMLINEPHSSKSNKHIVLGILGIGGMGKTTLAQLIFNDEEIRNKFENRWFACISDISDEREVLGKILQSIRGESCSELDVGQLHTKIRESVEDQKYLLVLDDVWEDDRTRWQDRVSLLTSRARESRIIVTTRLPSVVKAVGAFRPHNLEGLLKDDSWSLLKKSAFTEEYENDPRRKSLGKEILKKCCGVPLAIRSIGSLLYGKNTIEEWQAIASEDLPVLGRKYNDKTMRVLKLSYDHLPSYLKHCFAYCGLFPKDYVFTKRDLINHWIAQGYIDPNDEDSGFMHLLRRGFFQETSEGECGEIESCKMHDLIHDLAIYVAGDESVVPSSTLSSTGSCVRHVSLEASYNDISQYIFTLELNAKSLRSLLLIGAHWWSTPRSLKLDQLFSSVKLLRTLSLSKSGINNIPPSIGELKLMRHLDLSYNSFEELPHFVANLVNLLSLNLEGCKHFTVWPLDFHKLSNLRYLNIRDCDKLRFMPSGIGKMTHLRYLEDFKTDKGNECLNSSATLLQQLKGKLSIRVRGDPNSEVDGDECNWQLPVSLYQLEILNYLGMRMPGWGDYGRTNNPACLKLIKCWNVKYLPSLRCLPNLRWILLKDLNELEFMEEDEDGSICFPCLEELHFEGLLNLKRWWRKVSTRVTSMEFPRLHQLFVRGSPDLELESFPLCPRVKLLALDDAYGMQSVAFCFESIAISRTKWQRSLGSLQDLKISNCHTLKSIELVVQQHLKDIVIRECDQLNSIELVEAHILASPIRTLFIYNCKELEILRASEHMVSGFEQLDIIDCLKLRLEKTPILPSPTTLNHLGGSIWTIGATVMDDIDLIDQLSWLPIEKIGIVLCTMPISFPVTPFSTLLSLIIHDADGLEILQLDASPLLQEVFIMSCKSLTSVEVEAPSCILISGCPKLKNLRIADPDALKEFSIRDCPELEEVYKDQLMRTQSTRDQPKIPIFGVPYIVVKRISGEATNTYDQR